MPTEPQRKHRPSHLATLAIPVAALITVVLGASPGLCAESSSPLTIQPDTSRVGINTPAPERTLDVNGTARVTDTLTINNRVGIGIDNPSHALEVNGSVRATTGTILYQFASPCGGTGQFTLGATCTTRVCATECHDLGCTPSMWLTCTGSCSKTGGPATCNNPAVGRLMAP